MLNLVKKTRTFRIFEQNKEITDSDLTHLVNLARLGGSAANCQPWQYMTVKSKDLCTRIFPFLGWAGYLSDWKGPAEGERPNAYILCFLNKKWLKGSEKLAYFDLGTASQNLLLGAMEKGIGGCRIGAFSPDLAKIFTLPEHIELHLVIALGYPAEEVVLEDLQEEDNIRYWRTEDGIHHVPKRSIDDITVNFPLNP